MNVLDEVKSILGETLSLGDRAHALREDTVLLGGIPEFDSMAVVSVIVALEENFGFIVDDDEVSGEVFNTVGTLRDFVVQKLEN